VQRAVVTVSRQRDLPVAFIIRPDAMPAGSALLLPFLDGMPANFKDDNTGVMALPPVVLNNDTVPACVAQTKSLPSSPPPPVTKQSAPE
jgi:hypothetical protein